jgi:lactate dehydrogenase-like 2-hydroxyacid dehydrogenase
LDKALGKEVISIFVDSKISDDDLRRLKESGTKKIAVRSVGTDMLNIELAKEVGLNVFRIASYSPESIAEHVYALLLGLVRKLMFKESSMRRRCILEPLERWGGHCMVRSWVFMV